MQNRLWCRASVKNGMILILSILHRIQNFSSAVFFNFKAKSRFLDCFAQNRLKFKISAQKLLIINLACFVLHKS